MKKKAEEFYNSLAENYDSMISFETSLKSRVQLLKNFIPAGITNAADLGCGTGLDSTALSKLGLKVTGFDLSIEMIAAAKKNSRRFKVNPEFIAARIDEINRKFYGKFSFALSLGNSLANINKRDLKNSLKRANAILQPNGLLLIQLLNYDRILKEKERIVGIKKTDNKTFIRFYDFCESKMYFNVLSVDKTKKEKPSLITTEIFPHKLKELTIILKEAGFIDIKKYGGLDKSVFNLLSSKDLVLIAAKKS